MSSENYENLMGETDYSRILDSYLETRLLMNKSLTILMDQISYDIDMHLIGNNIEMLTTSNVNKHSSLVKESDIDLISLQFPFLDNLIDRLVTDISRYEHLRKGVYSINSNSCRNLLNEMIKIDLSRKTLSFYTIKAKKIENVLPDLDMANKEEYLIKKKDLDDLRKISAETIEERNLVIEDIDSLNYGKYLNRWFKKILKFKLERIDDELRRIDFNISMHDSDLKMYEERINKIEALRVLFSNPSLRKLIDSLKSRLETMYGPGFIIERI